MTRRTTQRPSRPPGDAGGPVAAEARAIGLATARGLLQDEVRVCDPAHLAAAQRMLDLHRRAATLDAHARAAHARELAASPLSSLRVDGVRVRPPLCLADEPPEVWAVGCALAADGVPVALERGEDGRRRGVPLADVVDAARAAGLAGLGGGEPGSLDVLIWLDAMTRSSPRRLRGHHERRLAAIPTGRDRCEVSMRFIEDGPLLDAAEAKAQQPPAVGERFIAMVDPRALRELLACAAACHLRGGGAEDGAVELRAAGGSITAAGRELRLALLGGEGSILARASDLRAAAVNLDGVPAGSRAVLVAGDAFWSVSIAGDDWTFDPNPAVFDCLDAPQD